MKKWIKNDSMVTLLEIMIIGVILFPIIYISIYAIPSSDDFCNAVVLKRMLNGNNAFITEVFKQLYIYYTQKGGFLFSLMITTFIQPYMWGGLTALRLTIALINLAFYYSLWFLVSTLLKEIYRIIDKRILLGIYLLLMIPFAVNNYYNDDILAWYCGSGAYVLVVSCMLLSISFLLKGMCQNKIKWIVLACVLGFLTSGGALNVAALNCGVFLLILMWGGGQSREKSHFYALQAPS